MSRLQLIWRLQTCAFMFINCPSDSPVPADHDLNPRLFPCMVRSDALLFLRPTPIPKCSPSRYEPSKVMDQKSCKGCKSQIHQEISQQSWIYHDLHCLSPRFPMFCCQQKTRANSTPAGFHPGGSRHLCGLLVCLESWEVREQWAILRDVGWIWMDQVTYAIHCNPFSLDILGAVFAMNRRAEGDFFYATMLW